MAKQFEYELISLPLQKLLYEIYFNNKKLTFQTQSLYKSRQPFNRAIQKLIKWNAVRKRDCFINNSPDHIFELTTDGIVFVQSFLIDFHECQTKSEK